MVVVKAFAVIERICRGDEVVICFMFVRAKDAYTSEMVERTRRIDGRHHAREQAPDKEEDPGEKGEYKACHPKDGGGGVWLKHDRDKDQGSRSKTDAGNDQKNGFHQKISA